MSVSLHSPEPARLAQISSNNRHHTDADDGLRAGDLVDHYEIRSPLNHGGQGTVFRAWDRWLQREVALKIGHASSLSLSRLLEEGALLARLRHPQLVQVYDCGLHRGIPFLVMEYVPSISLSEYVRRRRRVCVRQIRTMLTDLASALAAAHGAGILHLDLKPDNVLVTSEGRCKLIDFGLGQSVAPLSPDESPRIAGTAQYMSPEQRTGQVDRLTPATDVFGLGGILYHLLTGQVPMPNDLALGTNPSLLQKTLAACHANTQLSRLCLRSLLADPNRRPRDASGFLKQLTGDRRLRTVAGLCLLAGAVFVGSGMSSLFPSAPVTTAVRAAAMPPSASASEMVIDLQVHTASPLPPFVVMCAPQQPPLTVTGLVHDAFTEDNVWTFKHVDRLHVVANRAGWLVVLCCPTTDKTRLEASVISALAALSTLPHFAGAPDSIECNPGTDLAHTQLPKNLRGSLENLQRQLNQRQIPYTFWLQRIEPRHASRRRYHFDLSLPEVRSRQPM